MDLDFFYAPLIEQTLSLPAEEAQHCSRVMRHQVGDSIRIADGRGTLFDARITLVARNVVDVELLEAHRNFASHNYELTMAVAPTKNADRFEWFVEKAVEIGVDRIVPLEGEWSERRRVNLDRLTKIAVAAMKQSHKAALPRIDDLTPARDFIRSYPGRLFMAHCHEGRKSYLYDALPRGGSVAVMIGPEGDFSPAEVALAGEYGCRAVSLGPCRLRTETAAVFATVQVATRNYSGLTSEI